MNMVWYAIAMSILSTGLAVGVSLLGKYDYGYLNVIGQVTGAIAAYVLISVFERRRLGNWRDVFLNLRWLTLAIPMVGALGWLVSLVV